MCTYQLHIYVYACMFIHKHIHTYIHMYIHTYIHLYIVRYMHTYVCTYVCTSYIHICMNTYMRTYIYTHRHFFIVKTTYINMYILGMYVCMCMHENSCAQHASNRCRQTHITNKQAATMASLNIRAATLAQKNNQPQWLRKIRIHHGLEMYMYMNIHIYYVHTYLSTHLLIICMYKYTSTFEYMQCTSTMVCMLIHP